MSDRESPEGGPPRKKLATSQTPGEGTSGAQASGVQQTETNVDLLQKALNEALKQNIDYGQQSSGPSGVSGVDPNPLPPDVVNFYALRRNQILGIDENDKKLLCFHIPRYLIENTLGSGSYGSVYRAQQTSGPNTRETAIKILKAGVGNASAITIPKERVIIDLLKPHKHENVVFFYELFYRRGLKRDIQALYIVSELSTVGDLYNTVRTRNPQGIRVWVPIKEGVAKHLIKGIANGVQHLKTLNLCHGDVKLENVLLFDKPAKYRINDELDRTRIDRWIPKLTDFGNSRLRNNNDPPGKLLFGYPICTIHYASPESWLRNPDGSCNVFDAYSADVYSVGVCLISLLIGANPFLPPFMGYPNQNDPEFHDKLRTYAIKSNGIKNNISYLEKLFSYRSVDYNSQTV